MAIEKEFSLKAHCLLLISAIVFFSIWANLSVFFPGRPALLSLVPPFSPSYDANLILHLGAENRNIGEALYRGEGFSNPFELKTGPTAWMPPVYPALISILFLIFGGSAIKVALTLVFLTAAVLIWMGRWLLDKGMSANGRKGAWQVLAIYLVVVFLNTFWLFQLLHDVWINAFALLVLFKNIESVDSRGMSPRNVVGWGGVCGLLPLINPINLIIWFAFSTYFLIRKKPDSVRAFRPWVIAAALFVLPTCLWTARNYTVFHEFIPIKSNLFFDAYQANYLSDSGLFDPQVARQHPYLTKADSLYAKLGESGFNDYYRAQFLSHLRSQPSIYLAKIFKRCLAIFFIFAPFSSSPGASFTPALYLLQLLWGFSLLTVYVLRRKELGRQEKMLGAFVLLYLLPYMLVSYYFRYQLPLIAFQALILAHFLFHPNLSPHRRSPRL
jgi:hypothetical protein